MVKRAQAALEFLTTYAWAFLVIIVMIGALAYFGVLNPTRLLPDRCTFSTEVQCIDYNMRYGTGADGEFNLRLKNSFGEPVVINAPGDFLLESETATQISCTMIEPAGGAFPFTWNTAAIQDFRFNNCNTQSAGFGQGDKEKIAITLDFYLAKSSAAFTRQIQGEVFSTVQ